MTRLQLLKAICRNNGVRDIVEMHDCDARTVQSYIRNFGIALLAAHNRIVTNLSPDRVELDEVKTFVYAKSDSKPFSERAPSWAGDWWTWTAIDPDSKMLIAWRIGQRGLRDAYTFMADVRSKIPGRCLITSDSLKAYSKAIERTFGADGLHVRIVKFLRGNYDSETRERRTTVVAIHKRAQQSVEVDLDRATTAHNERHNLTIRTLISRFNRQSLRFSKSLENHICAHAIYSFYYNFRKEHRGLPKGITPAMAAGVADKVYSFEDIMDEIDNYWASIDKADQPALQSHSAYLAAAQLEPGMSDPSATFFVCHDRLKRASKVHAGPCNNCRFGRGRGGMGKTNDWFAFNRFDEAWATAQLLEPDSASVCAMCITRSYRTKAQPVGAGNGGLR